MELTSSHPFWSVRNGLLATYPSLDRDLNCDVVIIGGGVTGALIGEHFAKAGVKTVLLDQRDIGTGSTSASTGLLQYEVDVPLRKLAARIGTQKADRSYRLCLEAVQKIGALVKSLNLRCDFERKPSLFLARGQKEVSELREEFLLRKKIGIDLEFWDATQVEKNFPFKRPAALFSRDAAQIDPHRFTDGLLHHAVKNGLQVFDRTEVARIIPQTRGVGIITASGHKIKARRVVVAAGFEAKRFLRGGAGRLKSTYALISEPVKEFTGWHRRSLIWESGLPYLYLRTTADNRIIVGGEDEDFVDASRRDILIPKKAATLARKFKKLFPEIKLEVAYAWAGTFGETKDGLAYIGKNKSLPHAYFALGYGGNGITYSVIAAEIIRDDFLGRKNSDASIFRFGR